MPDINAPSPFNAPSRNESADTTGEIRNLPVLVPTPNARESRDKGERWLTRLLRALFGW